MICCSDLCVTHQKVPLILKGVQTWEDALEAYDQGLAGIVLSNHGGRQLDFARSGIEVLVEVVAKFKEKRGVTFPNDRFQLFVDGGVRRATDVLKAIALGATAGAYLSHAARKMDTFKPRFSGDR